MGQRFNTPPGWPPPPEGWVPPQNWTPDPSWPPAPPGWQFWVDTVPAPPVSADPSRPAPQPPPAASKPGGGGLFGGKKRLEVDNAELRAALERAGAMPAYALEEERQRLESKVTELHREADQVAEKLTRLQAAVVQTEEITLLQEAGIYHYSHPLDTAAGYKDLLARVRTDTKAMAKNGQAVHATSSWQINGSIAQGRVMVRDFSKLLLRAYNAEADNCVRTVKPHRLDATVDRLTKAADTIARLGKTMDIRIAPEYHHLRVYEIKLTADHLAKVEEEKERTRAERERLREEEAARRDFEREKARLAKERTHYASVLTKLQAGGASQDKVDEVLARLGDIDQSMTAVISREANIRAGYVYVISNLGAFGERMVKIGLTRRLEPLDRVRELGDASVPFRFDVHALVFSDDAVTLETQLHQRLADRKVNRVNIAREFFYATPAEVRDLLADVAGQHLLEYSEIAEAAEWRASQKLATMPG